MDTAQTLAALAFQSLGYFVIEGLKVGRKEADILAIRLGDDGSIAERLHVEVQVSTKPIGFLRGEPSLRNNGKTLAEHAADYVDKKFKDPLLVKAIVERLGSGSYGRMFIHGKLLKPEQLKTLRKRKIETKPIGILIEEARRAGRIADLERTLEVNDLLTLKDAYDSKEP